ncbi:18230_t:CDS:10 [Entrophospora sp. SA101]|nr:18230_t:CDS:10 [Entrophospora sp. SA101]
MSKLIEEKLAFVENETVLCFHGPLLYEAKILEVKNLDHKDSIAGKKEDIKVTQLEYTKIPKKYTQKHKRQKIIDENSKNNSSNLNENNSDQIENKGGSIQKSYDEDLAKDQKIVDNDKKFTEFFETKIIMPQPLKIKLIEDWEIITKNQKLYQLPRQITVVDILKEYLDYKQNTINESVDNSTIDSPSKQSIVSNDESSNFEMNKMELYNEITEGILTYFNKSLQKILLYNYERVQNTEIRVANPDKEYSEIYGAEHLLRLFVEIPQLLSQNEFNQSTAEKPKTNKKKALGGLTCANCKTPNTPNWRAGEKPGQKLCNVAGGKKVKKTQLACSNQFCAKSQRPKIRSLNNKSNSELLEILQEIRYLHNSSERAVSKEPILISSY